MKNSVSVKVFLILLFLTGLLYSQSQVSSNKTVIFLIDLSGSMNKNNLFENVKTSIKNALSEAVNPGDRVVIMGFHSNVMIIDDRVVGKGASGLEDSFGLQQKIDNLSATGRYTYITKALDITAKYLKTLQKADPLSLKIVYLFTDGKNEPPPDIQNPITYSDIGKKYFSTFSSKNAYTYVFTFGQKELKKEKTKIEKATGAIITDLPRGKFPQLSFFVLTPFRFNLEMKKTSLPVISDSIMVKPGMGKIVKPVKVRFRAVGSAVKLDTIIAVNKIGQQIVLPLKIFPAKLNKNKPIFIRVKYETSRAYVLPDSILLAVNISAVNIIESKPAVTPVKVTRVPKRGRKISKTVLIIIAFIIIIGAILVYCKFLKPNFSLSASLIHEYSSSVSSFDLQPLTGFCKRKITIGPGGDIDLGLGDISFSLKPLMGGRILVKVKEGALEHVDGSEKLWLGEGESYRMEETEKVFTHDEHKIKIVNEGEL